MIELVLMLCTICAIVIAIMIGFLISAKGWVKPYDPYELLLDAQIAKLKKKKRYLSQMDRKGGKPDNSDIENRPKDPKGSNQDG